MEKAKLITLIIVALFFVQCNETFREKSPNELRIELQSHENSSPKRYIKLENVVMNKNKIRDAGIFRSAKYDGYLISGKVVNSATIARYKDLKITVDLFSKTKTLISQETYVFYEYYEPNSTKNFEIKINPSSKMESFGVSVTEIFPVY